MIDASIALVYYIILFLIYIFFLEHSFENEIFEFLKLQHVCKKLNNHLYKNKLFTKICS